MRIRPVSIVLAAVFCLLAWAPRAGAQCQMIFNVSVYNDAALSEDVTMVYGFSTTSDNSSLCTCGHGSYQTRTTVYAPDGTQSTVISSGFTSYVAVPTNGRMGTYTVTGAASLFCSCAGLVGAGGVAATVAVAPRVTIQVEPARRQGSNGFVLTGETTALTATGYPGGGAYVWQLGPKLSLAGSGASANTAVMGTQESSSIGDTWVEVSYTVGGQTAVASVRFTVRETRRLVALSLGGPGGTTLQFDANAKLIGYLTNITYVVRDQFNNNIELAGIVAIETLRTVSVSQSNVQFSPPDGVPQQGFSQMNGTFFDYLSLENGGKPLPEFFSAIRNQDWILRSTMLWPTQVQRYSSTFAEVVHEVLSW
ncbi:MAG: hypothetical protein KatS3mg004_2835 [Bryobacteraceae bacterium]|nr:MAG: hypothetical protein KatS3mg004_2835 [Bryobacteraceae bacterium]